MTEIATPNLDLLYMQVGAPNREIVVNDGLAVLDARTAGVLALDLAGSGDYVLTDTIQGEAKYGCLRVSGALTGARTLLVPAKGRQYLIENQTTGAFTLTVKTATGSGVVCAPGTWNLLVCDGLDVFATVVSTAGSAPPLASETAAGLVELATAAETQTGTDATRAVTPAGLSSRSASETASGLVELATTAEVTAGTDDLRAVTPLKLAQRVAAATPPVASETASGLVELATTAEVTTGTDDARAVTPLKLAQRVAALPAASETVAGLVELATQAETQALTDLTRAVTPGRLATLTPVDTRLGLIELATPAEVTTGTDTVRAVTPATLAARIAAIPAVPAASETVAGLVELATGAEVTTGTDDARAVTPLKLQQRLTAVLPPAASETVAGIVELATSAETTTGTDTTRAVTPAALAAKVPSGTPLSVPRYAASGTALEASPITVDAAGAVIAKATNIQPVWSWQSEHTTTTGGMFLEAYQPGTGSPSFGFRKAKGTIAAPVRETSALGGSGNLYGQLYARDAANTADAWVMLAQIQFMTESLDAQGRAGGYIRFSTAPGVSAPQAEVARLTGLGGNLLLGLTSYGTGLTKGLALGSGTAPSTSPGDAVQLWVADRAGLAGKGSLYLRSEDGTVHVLGDWVGLGTTTPRSILDVNGSASITKLGLNGVEASSAVPLTFGAAIAHKMYLYENGLQRYGLGIASSTMQLFAPNPGGKIDLGGLDSADGTTFQPWFSVHGATGNIGLGQVSSALATVGTRVLSWRSGVAPTAGQVDAVQMWVADRAGTAGSAALHLRDETGATHVIGDMVGFFTTEPVGNFNVVNASAYFERHDATANAFHLITRKSRGTQAAPARLIAGDGVALYSNQGYVRNGADTADFWNYVTRIESVISTMDAQGRAGGALVFYTMPPLSGTITEQMRIDHNGWVGIGLPGPQARLHITNENLTTGQLVLGSQRAAIVAGNVLGGIECWSNDTNLTSPGLLSAYARAKAVTTHTATDLGSEWQWGLTTLGAPTPVEAMRLTSQSTLLLAGATAGNGLVNGLVMKSGTAPTSSQADTVQLWVEDFDGLAGQASLCLRAETGRIVRLGQGLLTTMALVATTTATTAAPYVLTEDDSNRVCISNNTTAQTQFTLPGAANGLTYTFTLYAGASGVRVRAATGDSIRGNGVTSVPGGAIETTTLYSALTLVAVNGAVWMITSMVGTWAMVA